MPPPFHVHASPTGNVLGEWPIVHRLTPERPADRIQIDIRVWNREFRIALHDLCQEIKSADAEVDIDLDFWSQLVSIDWGGEDRNIVLLDY